MESEGEILLQQILQGQMDEAFETENQRRMGAPTPATASEDIDEKKEKVESGTHTQWALGGNGMFTPVGSTAPTLPSGIFEPFALPGIWGLQLTKVASDGIYVLPDMATETVLEEVKKFWSAEETYRRHKLLYKRGIIMWGPPGGGKTVAVKLLMNELVKREGIVIVGTNVPLTIMCLKAVRRIEPKRNLIVVFEDIDEIINYHGEASVLSMLDGESNVDNVLHLATTNYPERLGARIINRPSRFDRRVYVGMPSDESRQVYLDKATNQGLDHSKLTKWVADTKGMSIAHLRELVAAVYCLEQPYEDVIDRLKNMATPIKGEDGFKAKTFGFSNPQAGRLSEG